MLCNTPPHNHQITVAKVETIIQQLSQDGEQLCKMISSADTRKINQIITYIFVKLCYSNSSPGLQISDVLDRLIDSTGTTIG